MSEPVTQRPRDAWGHGALDQRHSAVVIAALALGLGMGWFYARAHPLDLVVHGEWLERLPQLVVLMATTLMSIQIVRSGAEKHFWNASIGMLPAVFLAHSRALIAPYSWPAVGAALMVGALWLGVSFACDRRRRRLAFGCITLCGGLATSIILCTWSDIPARQMLPFTR